MQELYIGLMSGTSLDGIDAVLVDFHQPQPKLIASHYAAYHPEFRKRILSLCHPGADEINRMSELDILLGKELAEAALHLLRKNNLSASNIHAIGSHGQTIRHHPDRNFTLQIGDPNVIAAETGITTIADFRRRDIALGGQGAPLVPAFHHAMFATNTNRIIVNIGGITNITVLPAKSAAISGFDIGPGNTLLDAWTEKHLAKNYDEKGNWGRQGTIQPELLNKMLADPFFKQIPPKSTGREYFNLNWLTQFSIEHFQPADVQATLTELTARTIIDAIKNYFSEGEMLLCGGGTHNTFLMEKLQQNKNYHISTTEKYGIHPDWVEAVAFAWLAKQTLEKKSGNLIAVTGAKQSSILGGIYYT